MLFRLFGVEVRGAEEDDDAEPMELKKSTSMPNLACASTARASCHRVIFPYSFL